MTQFTGSDRTNVPGRLGDPGMSLRTDPRVHRGVTAAMAPFGLDEPASAPPVSHLSARADLLEFVAGAESAFESVFEALLAGLPETKGVVSETRTVRAVEGHEISLHISRPEHAQGPLPCVYQIHGGGMAILGATSAPYSRVRQDLAATGLVVVGVEFRNAAGKLGPHPYPAGLEDCATGLRWIAANTAELGVSTIVLSGDSGGANLALALAIKAKREGFLDAISGVYAQCPHIFGKWADDDELPPSVAENNGYLIHRGMLEVLAEVYDPGSVNVDEATCWPSRATNADLEGLPPHVITVNEVDPLRDEGLDYYRKLLAAGVPTTAWLNMGLSHEAETLFPTTLPHIYRSTLLNVSSFAHSLA